jgi:hypothetical protein
MKQWFLMFVVLAIPAAVLGWLFYSLGRYLYTAYDNWKELGRLDAIKAEADSIRARRRQANEGRLANGCAHAFHSGMGFPPGVCLKCGLAQDKPLGDCDHVWRRVEGPIPASRCEKCGKEYRTQST